MAVEPALQGLWHDHTAATFPAGCVGREVADRDLQILATEVAGAVEAYILRRDEFAGMEDMLVATLEKGSGDLSRVVTQLEGEAAEYFGRLLVLAEMTLAGLGRG